MTISTPSHLNSPEAVATQIKARRIGWIGTLVMTFLITVLAAITSVGLTALFAATGNPKPGNATLTWINVWNTVIYIPVLLALAYFVRKEGIRIADLIGFEQAHLVRDVLQGIGFGFLLFIVNALVQFGISSAVYGGNPLAAGASFAQLGAPPLLTVIFGLIGVPLGAGIVEELVYRGYALPRLAGLSNRWIGLLIMSLGFGLQHVSLSLSGDWHYALARGITMFLVGAMMGLIYFKQKRLLPLIVGHVVWDLLGVGVLSSLLPWLLRH